MQGTHIVKRGGHKEKFDEKKVYASIYWACRTSHLHGEKCEQIAGTVVKQLLKKFEGKKEINSNEIFDFVVKELENHHGASAYMYKTHRDIS